MNTFANDPRLPALPLPELRDTCAAVPELVAPLVDGAVLAATRSAFEALARPGGPGEGLHGALEALQRSLPGNASWLRPFWDDMYLTWRAPLPVHMNYFFRFSEAPWGGVAALPRLILALTHTLRRLGRAELAPEPAREGFQAMDQTASCLYTRIPAEERDSLRPVRLHGPLHIAVSCRGRWFTLALPKEQDDPFAGRACLERGLDAIRREAETLPPGPAVAAMTAAPRPEAAALRARLQQHLQNRLSLAALEGSLFVVCLDPPSDSPESVARGLLCGDAASRWYDKSLQLIATESGELGANFEHAGGDAAIWLYLLGQANALLTAPETAGRAAEPEPDPSWRALRWEVDAALAGRFEAARREAAALGEGLDLTCRQFPSFARNRLKALGTSPDAFLQIAFQTAQHRVFGWLRSSYEAIAMRSFAEGRTECARGSSGDALAFAEALAQGAAPEGLLALYRQAERTHKLRMRRCQSGLGVERHIYGLEAMYRLHGPSLGQDAPPAAFNDPGWRALKHDALSTSGIGAPFIHSFGFGPTVEDGFGVGYAPGPENTGLVVSACKASGLRAAAFLEAFEQAARAMADVLAQAQGPEK